MSNTTQTTQEVIDLVKQNIAPITEALVDGGEYGFQLLVRKAFFVDGIIQFVSGVVIALIAVILSIKLFKVFTDYKLKPMSEGSKISSAESEMAKMTLGFMFIFVLIIGPTTGLILIFESLPNMILPEYYAILEAINFIK